MEICRQMISCAEGGEVVISNSTRDLVSGSGIALRKKNVPEFELFAGVSELLAVECESGLLPQ